jgi:hypothetical protein
MRLYTSGSFGLDPRQFGGGEVAGGVEESRQHHRSPAEGVERLFTVRDGAAVTPDDRGSQRLAVPVDGDETVHLVGDPDRGDPREVRRLSQFARRLDDVAPPHRRILLRPVRPQCADRHFRLGSSRRREPFSRVEIDEARLDRRAPHIVAKGVACHIVPPVRRS